MTAFRKVFFVSLLFLLIFPISNLQAADLDVGVWGGGGCCNDSTRGYWFVAPIDFTITGLSVPTDGPGAGATLEVLRLNTIPPQFSNTTNDFVQLGYWSGVTETTANISVNAGDIIGILGWADGRTPYGSGPYSTTLGGEPVTLSRLGFQDLGQAYDVWTESSSIGVIGLEYELSSPPPQPIPTLSEWGMIIFSLLLAGSAIWMMKRRRVS